MLIYLWLIFEGKKKWPVIVGTADVLWAVAVHMGTGAIFGLIGNREIFFSPIKPFEFLAAALTSGTSLIILVCDEHFQIDQTGDRGRSWFFLLGRLLSYMIIVLLVMVFVDKLTHLYFPNRESTVYLFTGDYWWIFWVFQIGMGIAIPLILLMLPRTGKTTGGIVAAASRGGRGFRREGGLGHSRDGSSPAAFSRVISKGSGESPGSFRSRSGRLCSVWGSSHLSYFFSFWA